MTWKVCFTSFNRNKCRIAHLLIKQSQPSKQYSHILSAHKSGGRLFSRLNDRHGVYAGCHFDYFSRCHTAPEPILLVDRWPHFLEINYTITTEWQVRPCPGDESCTHHPHDSLPSFSYLSFFKSRELS
jgi:hypothetical protein